MGIASCTPDVLSDKMVVASIMPEILILFIINSCIVIAPRNISIGWSGVETGR